MQQDESPITVLSEEESWERLASVPVGRLVTQVHGMMDITPINFLVDDGSILFRTAPGEKLAKLAISEGVLFEADQIDADGAWSVVIHGSAVQLTNEDEILRAEQLPLRTFLPTLKPAFVRIEAHSVSGRAFVFGSEPRREEQQHG